MDFRTRLENLKVHPNTKLRILGAFVNKSGQEVWDICQNKDNKETRRFFADIKKAFAPRIDGAQKDWHKFCIEFFKGV